VIPAGGIRRRTVVQAGLGKNCEILSEKKTKTKTKWTGDVAESAYLARARHQIQTPSYHQN
jgi:hypothetical protein